MTEPIREMSVDESVWEEAYMRAVLAWAVIFMTFMSASAKAQGDATKGEQIFKRCQACHVVNQPTNRVGPTLQGVIGRKAGSVEGFKYSEANKNSDVIWDEATLDKYLTDPKAFMPGNKMAFPGLKKPEERADVIAYLKQASAK
jgi:cytochrome c